jgi:hypothetical protein
MIEGTIKDQDTPTILEPAALHQILTILGLYHPDRFNLPSRVVDLLLFDIFRFVLLLDQLGALELRAAARLPSFFAYQV